MKNKQECCKKCENDDMSSIWCNNKSYSCHSKVEQKMECGKCSQESGKYGGEIIPDHIRSCPKRNLECNHNGRNICNKDTCDGIEYTHNSHCIDCGYAIPVEQKSNCCNAEMLVFNGKEGTSHYDCAKCGEPCDAKVEQKECVNCMNFPCDCHGLKETLAKLNSHKCEEDHNGNCYFCGQSMLVEQNNIQDWEMDWLTNIIYTEKSGFQHYNEKEITHYFTNWDKVKEYISSLLSSQRDSLIKELESKKKENLATNEKDFNNPMWNTYQDGIRKGISVAISVIKGKINEQIYKRR